MLSTVVKTFAFVASFILFVSVAMGAEINKDSYDVYLGDIDGDGDDVCHYAMHETNYQMKILFFFYTFLISTYLSAEDREAVLLPVKRLGSIVDGVGNDLSVNKTHKLEFKTMVIFVHPRDQTGNYIFRPRSSCEASIELKSMLPADYFQRLIDSYSDETKASNVISDLAVEERLYDLIEFLNHTWLLDESPLLSYPQKTDILDFFWELVSLEKKGECQPDKE